MGPGVDEVGAAPTLRMVAAGPLPGREAVRDRLSAAGLITDEINRQDCSTDIRLIRAAYHATGSALFVCSEAWLEELLSDFHLRLPYTNLPPSIVARGLIFQILLAAIVR